MFRGGDHQGGRPPHARRVPGPQLSDLQAELATLTGNRVVPVEAEEAAALENLGAPTLPLRTRAFELIGVSPATTETGPRSSDEPI